MNNKVNILFIGVICSEKLISEMITNKSGNPNAAAQKYHRLLIEGMAKNAETFNIKILSLPEFNLKSSISGSSEIANSVNFRYLFYTKNKYLKSLINGIQLAYFITQWRANNRHANSHIMFDVLHLYSSVISLIFSKILRIKSIITITDLPELMYILNDKIRTKDKIVYSIQNFIIRHTKYYIVLTQSIKERFNYKNKKVIIIEGLVDENKIELTNKNTNFNAIKTIHYSGGLYIKFGVKTLIEAFMKINNVSIRLHLFGNGDIIEYINSCMIQDKRIKYFGYQANQIIINDQRNSFLLVNPRFSKENYTKYSFPSKTIEYMASGIPLVTNKLTGIPDEYFNYAFTFEDESIEGYKVTLEKLLELTRDEIIEFGGKAQSFVYNNKNNKLQASRLFKLLTL